MLLINHFYTYLFLYSFKLYFYIYFSTTRTQFSSDTVADAPVLVIWDSQPSDPSISLGARGRAPVSGTEMRRFEDQRPPVKCSEPTVWTNVIVDVLTGQLLTSFLVS